MKKHCAHIFSIVAFLYATALNSFGQNVGINATGAEADTSAGLDVNFTNKGLLIPRIALIATGDAATITRPATGLMVYNPGTGGLAPAGYYYNAGTKAAPNWTNFIANNWKITGNSGMVDGTNFIGPTDSVAFNFRVKNIKSGLIDPAGATFFGYKAGLVNNDITNTGVGYMALYSVTDGAGNGGANTAIGYQALYLNTAKNNTAVGYLALRANTTGQYNTAAGPAAPRRSTVGSYNTASGPSALTRNTTANYNTAVGVQALTNDTSGSGNTAVGYLSLPAHRNGNYNTADGYQTLNATTTGSENTAFGFFALKVNTTGSYNTAIGREADVTVNNLTKATAIGYKAKVPSSSSFVIGGKGADSVLVGIGLTTPKNSLTVSGSIAGKYREGNTVTMDAADFFVNLTAAGGSTLPTAVSVTAGTHVIIRNSTAAAITLSASGTDTMCNIGVGCAQTSVSIPAYSVVHYTSDGTSVWMGW
ncbi:MAG: hypothetical protein HYU69_01390 [Bacteroidetes bacterium]|nr:hypothetical protein [Bacteroidota bacterium]